MNRDCTRDRVSLALIAIAFLLSVSCASIDKEKPVRRTVKALPPTIFTERSKTKSADNGTPPSPVPISMIGMISSKLEKSGMGREDDLIIVTMNSEKHRRLLLRMAQRPGLSDKSELPERHQGFLNRLNARYGITLVANWPLDSIGLHCLIFETDGIRERHEIVTELASETDVESADAVQVFAVQRRR